MCRVWADCLWEEAVVQPCDGEKDAAVPSARWNKREKSSRGVKAVVQVTDGVVAVVNKNIK